jgi:hypothetical protein
LHLREWFLCVVALFVSFNEFFASFFGFGQADDVQQLTVKAFVKAVAVVGEKEVLKDAPEITV